MRYAVLSAAALAPALLGASYAQAETLVTSLSSQRLAITSNYTGAQVVAFGSIERDAQTVSRAASYDIVVTVRGPRQSIMVREKQAFGPIWLNRAQQKFFDAPAFLGVYANRPIEAITSEPLRKRLGVGLKAIVEAPTFTFDRGRADDSFRTALLRLKGQENLYVERGDGVTLLTSNLFRAPIPLPATAPPGNYDVEIALFVDGVPLNRKSDRFQLVKSGFEQQVADFARDQSTIYGLATAAMSLVLGWFASVIFRRD